MNILQSRAFYEILDEHKASLQAEVNSFVEKQEWTKAFGALRALRDVDRILRNIQLKLDELNKDK
jgi:hypothetical protein